MENDHFFLEEKTDKLLTQENGNLYFKKDLHSISNVDFFMKCHKLCGSAMVELKMPSHNVKHTVSKI